MAHATKYTKKKECEVKAIPYEEKQRLVREGKAHWFFPHHIVEQMVICMTIIMIMVTLATLFPAHLGPMADPFDTPDHIKPEWYFLPAFYTLKFAQYFEFLGSWAPKLLGIVIQGVAVTVLIAVPFLDMGGPERRPSKRPIAMTMGAIGVFLTLLCGYLGHIA